MTDRVAQFLLAAVCVLLGFPEATSSAQLERRTESRIRALAVASNEAAPRPVDPAFTSQVPRSSDDAMEVPDESEDEQPDEAGPALYHQGRSPLPPLDLVVAGTQHTFSVRRNRIQTVSLAPPQPRFLSLCRLLI